SSPRGSTRLGARRARHVPSCLSPTKSHRTNEVWRAARTPATEANRHLGGSFGGSIRHREGSSRRLRLLVTRSLVFSTAFEMAATPTLWSTRCLVKDCGALWWR